MSQPNDPPETVVVDRQDVSCDGDGGVHELIFKANPPVSTESPLLMFVRQLGDEGHVKHVLQPRGEFGAQAQVP